jgi:hypothetical protein
MPRPLESDFRFNAMMTMLTGALAALLLAPLVVLPIVLAFAILLGRMPVGGLWRDSFDPQALSVSRVYQSVAALSASASVLICIAGSGCLAFPPMPGWTLALLGGGNAIYLGGKWQASRRALVRK